MTPILSSVLRLVRYHLGTVAKGSFIITLVKIPRLVLMYIHNQLKGKVGACSAHRHHTCDEWIWVHYAQFGLTASPPLMVMVKVVMVMMMML